MSSRGGSPFSRARPGVVDAVGRPDAHACTDLAQRRGVSAVAIDWRMKSRTICWRCVSPLDWGKATNVRSIVNKREQLSPVPMAERLISTAATVTAPRCSGNSFPCRHGRFRTRRPCHPCAEAVIEARVHPLRASFCRSGRAGWCGPGGTSRRRRGCRPSSSASPRLVPHLGGDFLRGVGPAKSSSAWQSAHLLPSDRVSSSIMPSELARLELSIGGGLFTSIPECLSARRHRGRDRRLHVHINGHRPVVTAIPRKSWSWS